MIDFDVETTGLQWYEHDLFLVAFYHPDYPVAVLEHPAQREEIQRWLSADDDFRAWNTKFDLHFLREAGYTLPPEDRWHDGMVQAHILNENRSLRLKDIAGKMFGDAVKYDETEVKKWLGAESRRRAKLNIEPPNYSDIPDEILLPYAEQDVKLTRAICDQFDVALNSNEELAGVYEFERGVLAACFAVEERGIPIDRDAAVKFEGELSTRLDELEARCIELAGIRSFNPNSSAQIYEALKRRKADLRFVTKTKTGHSMDADNLATVDDDLARAILEFRGEFKILGTYVRPLLHSSWDSGLRYTKAPFITSANRIHPNIRQVGARTGRMSYSDPNLQNWPRDDLRLRYLLHAEPGHKLVAADLDSIELRLFAAYAGGAIKDALLRGEDLHSLTAANVGLDDRKRTTGIESARQRGKTLNYAMIYCAGVRSIRKTFGVSQDRARQIIDLYLTAYPEVRDLRLDVEWALDKKGYVKTAWGRHQRVDMREAYKAVNRIIQGTAADILKEALITLHKQGVPVIALVHDEILAHVPEGDAEEVAKLIETALTNHPRITEKIPLEAEAQIVDRWSQAKDPDFVPAYAC